MPYIPSVSLWQTLLIAVVVRSQKQGTSGTTAPPDGDHVYMSINEATLHEDTHAHIYIIETYAYTLINVYKYMYSVATLHAHTYIIETDMYISPTYIRT